MDNNIAAGMAQLKCNNNICYTLAFRYTSWKSV